MPSKIPAEYRCALGLYDTQKAIGLIKQIFLAKLCSALHLKRVTAPLFVDPTTGLNDNLSGVERPVAFDVPALDGTCAEVVQSLAKWKRLALHDYGFFVGNGLVADMNAIRRDEEMDNLHSIYVDQWDWEKVVDRAARTQASLRDTVCAIVHAICGTYDEISWEFPALACPPCRDVRFFTAQELEALFPALTPPQRETEVCRQYQTVFIQGIGAPLSASGAPHDSRAPDYDDWALNGDLLFWHAPLSRAVEISSMGIRVDANSMAAQLAAADCNARAALPFHKAVLDGTLPLTMGGGIGQSRLCMLLLGKAHVGEVQVSLWDEATRAVCAQAGVTLL